MITRNFPFQAWFHLSQKNSEISFVSIGGKDNSELTWQGIPSYRYDHLGSTLTQFRMCILQHSIRFHIQSLLL